MATLSLIAEPFPDWEAPMHFAGAHDLVNAIASTAPRSCSARFLLARGSHAPEFASPKIAVEVLPMRASSLPILWQSNATARPLDGEMTHSITPMMPLRARSDDDGTQSTVTVPHALAWEAPELLSPAQARLVRAFVKRAVRFADIIVTTSHSTASLLQNMYGYNLPVQVIPPVAPNVLLAGVDSAARRARLGLPERYMVTTANNDEAGRLHWVYNALEADSTLPHVVVITGLDPVVQGKGQAPTSELASRIPERLRNRITVVAADDLRDAGAVISGASLMLQPQSFAATGYPVIAALMSKVPVLHAGVDATGELVLDGGLAESDPVGFASALSRLFIASPGDGTSEFERLTVQAADRGRTFSWEGVAWQLWETHATI
ncbi:mannosyltransferase [Leucobacter denitrificans]|uniref:Mannosyltransferase n=1 Tax=Leucobacter denitrificans TaxID=683042 RepID=A0A7G9S3I2_9MICO|nr:mannosyltransferase [Leucobacter denitrificans]QNN62407.1 mannosyltransferase [Leucobacter denitrificans]